MRLSSSVFCWSLVLVVSASCGGLLALDERSLDRNPPCEDWRDCPIGRICQEQECVEADPCSPANPTAPYCPEGRHCVGGICVTDPSGGLTWCESCTSTQGCLDGVCVEITTDNACSPTHLAGVCLNEEVCVAGVCVPIVPDCRCDDPSHACPSGLCVPLPLDQACAPDRLDGLCPSGQLCVAGACVPMANDCSPERPWGLCPSGAACVNGYCLPIGERPCGPSALDGLCPAGQVCQPPGQCTPVPCSASQRSGHCEAGELCVNGVCLPLPCGPTQLEGACPANSFCSAIGACLPDGRCGLASDCGGGNLLCSCEEICINRDSCLADCDCPQFYACELGSGLCVRDYDCLTDVDCPEPEFCAESDTCLLDGSCEQDVDCRNGARFCSELASCATVLSNPNVCICLDVGQCRTDADCVNVDPAYACSSAGNCRPSGYCDGDPDCPPGYSCDTVTTHACVKGPNLCTDNDFTNLGCTGDEQLCCASGTCCATEGELCSSEDTCLDVGQCLTTEDCLGGVAGGLFVCSADYRCLPVANCDAGCDALTEKCSAAAETCVPKERCAGDADCAEGEYCHATFTCVPALNCGAAQTEVATLLKPNILLLVDRSSSMDKCDSSPDQIGGGVDCCGGSGWGACSPNCISSADVCTGAEAETSRWAHAMSAIDTITGTYDTALRFGLATYPLQWTCQPPPDPVLNCNGCQAAVYCTRPATCTWTGTACVADAAVCAGLTTRGQVVCDAAPTCAWSGGACLGNNAGCSTRTSLTCADPTCWPAIEGSPVTCLPNGRPGTVNVAINDFAYSPINQRLQTTYPGGGTPTGATLRGVRDNPYGLSGAGFTQDGRENVVILITDGEANNDRDVVSGPIASCTDADFACKVNAALDNLRATDATCAPLTSAGQAACEAARCRWVSGACAGWVTAPINTYVVGFSFAGVNSKLNCHAVHGGRSVCPAERDSCAVFTAGGTSACAAVGCFWTGTTCVGDNNTCARFTDDGEATCKAQEVCQWESSSSTCTGNTSYCGVFTGGGEPACTAGDCYWDSTTCRDICWTFQAGGQLACEAVDCSWTGACAGDDTACGALTAAGRATCEAAPACRWDGAGSSCEGDDVFCTTIAAGGQNACEAGLCYWTGAACTQIDATNCSTAVPACYYNATDAEALGAALDEIVAEVASCTFRLGTPPPDPNAMYVYLEYLDASAMPADCSNEPFDFCRLPRDRSRTDNWDYDPLNVQVEFYGNACGDVLAGRAVPLILFGCTGPGG